MNEWLIISIVILLLTITLGVIVALITRKKIKQGKFETDYRAFFILGICFLPMGILWIVLDNPGMLGLTAIGIIYMIIGLSNRDKWKKKK